MKKYRVIDRVTGAVESTHMNRMDAAARIVALQWMGGQVSSDLYVREDGTGESCDLNSGECIACDMGRTDL